MWERYCRGVQAIVFVVDSADLDSLVGGCARIAMAPAAAMLSCVPENATESNSLAHTPSLYVCSCLKAVSTAARITCTTIPFSACSPLLVH